MVGLRGLSLSLQSRAAVIPPVWNTISGDFATWTTVNATLTNGAASSPGNTNDAASLIENTANSNHRIQTASGFTANATLRIPLIVQRASGTRNLRITAYTASAGLRATYDLGALTSANGSYGNSTFSSATFSDLGGGWILTVLTGKASATEANPTFEIALVSGASTVFYTGDGTSGLFIAAP